LDQDELGTFEPVERRCNLLPEVCAPRLDLDGTVGDAVEIGDVPLLGLPSIRTLSTRIAA